MNLLGRNFRQVILRVSLVSLVVCVVSLLIVFKLGCISPVVVMLTILYIYAIVEACMVVKVWLEQRQGSKKWSDYLYAFLQFNIVMIPPSIALWLMGPGAIYIVIAGMAIMGYHG